MSTRLPTGVLGRAVRAIGLRARRARATARAKLRSFAPIRASADGLTIRQAGLTYRVLAGETPQEIRDQLSADVLAGLDDAGIRAFVVPGDPLGPHKIAIRSIDRSAAGAAILPRVDASNCYVVVGDDGGDLSRRHPTAQALLGVLDESVGVVTIARFHATRDLSLSHRFDCGCRLEFWAPVPGRPDLVEAPATNVAAKIVPAAFLEPPATTDPGTAGHSIELFRRRFLDDITFPIDAVYTWVDSNDPAWRERLGRAQASVAGEVFHADALSASRFETRDELRYSLRSLERYAPWLRHVYLVTDGQVPRWLTPDHPRLTVVDHRDIFRDPSVLPVFNSNAIITQLHHIDGLAEHYLYLNDDMFFGRELSVDSFWFSNGIAKVFPSRHTRPFGDPDPADPPHINITRNIRAMLEREFGVTVSRAIKHTPYPQRRSLHDDLEKLYHAELDCTMRNKFRHHLDVAQDQLLHYYAQIVGAAVPSSILYEYINVADARDGRRLRDLLTHRKFDVFCLNDAPSSNERRIPDDTVQEFLETYFPYPSSFEVAPVAGPSGQARR